MAEAILTGPVTVAIVWFLVNLGIGVILGAGAGLWVRWMMQQCNPACPLQ